MWTASLIHLVPLSDSLSKFFSIFNTLITELLTVLAYTTLHSVLLYTVLNLCIFYSSSGMLDYRCLLAKDIIDGPSSKCVK